MLANRWLHFTNAELIALRDVFAMADGYYQMHDNMYYEVVYELERRMGCVVPRRPTEIPMLVLA